MSKEHWDNSFSDEDFVYGERENVFIHDMSEMIPDLQKLVVLQKVKVGMRFT